MRMVRVFWFTVVALAGLLATQTAATAEPRIGTAVRIVKDVTADARALVTGDGVNQNETVEVRADSLGELKLDDNTKLALGPGARLKLDKFVYDPAKSQGDVAVSLVKGAFRFVTGNAPKKDYKIRTPNAAISVRGTVFDVFIADDGEEYLLLHEGSIEVCQGDGRNRSTCQVLQNVCNIIRVSPQGTVSRPQGWNNGPSQRVSFVIAFPFVVNPPTVDPVFYNTADNVQANSCNAPQGPIQRTDYVPPSPPQYPDPPASGPPENPNPLPVPFSWTGIYVGVHGGGTNTSTTSNASCQDTPSTINSSCMGDTSGSLFQQGTLDFSSIHAGGGVQAGGRMQFGILVVGIDIDVTRLSGSDQETYVAFDTEFGFDTTVEQQMRWFGTTRATAGIAFGNILIFVTGGVAVGDVEYGVGRQNYDTVFQSVVQVGYVAGGGFEIGLGLISFRGEFLHFDLGDETVVNPMNGEAFTASQFQNTGDTFRFAINFKLN